MAVDPALARLRERILAADAARTPLRIRGAGTKDFYGNTPRGEPLDTRDYRGIVAYEPTELVITARCGTPLAEIEAALAEHGQWLPFEPPSFEPPTFQPPSSQPLPSDSPAPQTPPSGNVPVPAGGAMAGGATIGGVVAAGLSGPGRQAAGAARDYVLGAAMIDARGRALHFGGQVMKNVAGYDVSRLLCGSLGFLGLIAEVSLKVLPRPAATATVAIRIDAKDVLRRLNEWGGRPLPISASAWLDGVLSLRLSGARAAVDAALDAFAREHGAVRIDDDEARTMWTALRNQSLPFFRVHGTADRDSERGDGRGETQVDAHRDERRDGHPAPSGPALWRLSVPSTASPLSLPGEQLIEWGGALRWWRTDADTRSVRQAAARVGGHATLFRGGDRAAGVFTPLAPPILQLHRRLKAEFDPNGIFDPGRLVAEL